MDVSVSMSAANNELQKLDSSDVVVLSQTIETVDNCDVSLTSIAAVVGDTDGAFESDNVETVSSFPHDDDVNSSKLKQEDKVLVHESNDVDTTDNTQLTTLPATATPATVTPDKPVKTEEKVDAIPRTSVRELLRARLREKEKVLSTLVRNTGGDGGTSVLTEIKTVHENLKLMEQEKSELEKELSRLKSATDDDDFLKEKMAGIQEGFEKQVKKIQSLQHEVGNKNNEIDMLRTELVKKLKRIVELEFEVQTHEIHYTEYAEQQYKLGEEALLEVKDMKRLNEEKSSHPDDDSISVVSTMSSLPRNHVNDINSYKKAQRLISKLLSDLDNLELRYKEEKLMSAAMIEKLTWNVSDLKTKAEISEQRLLQIVGNPNNGSVSDGKEPESFETQNAAFLRRRVEVLEAKKAINTREIENLRVQVEDIRRGAAGEAKRAEYAIARLESENAALKAHIQQLEAKGRRRKSATEQATEQYATIKTKIEENHNLIIRQQNMIDIKERQINTLKKEVANLRMRDISEGKVQNTSFTRTDTAILRASSSAMFISHPPLESDGSIVVGTGGANGNSDDTHAYIVDLQKQLKDAQQQVVKKDQELVIERAKAASTAAGLLSRITELTGQKFDATSKHVPRRFYL